MNCGILMATEVGWARGLIGVMVIDDDGDTTCAETFPQIAPRLVDPNNKCELLHFINHHNLTISKLPRNISEARDIIMS